MSRQILHVITGLETGGAELSLVRVVGRLGQFPHQVISLTGRGTLGPRLEELGVRVRALELPRGRVTAAALWRLASWIRAARPALVETWMYHANLLGGLAARLVSRAPVIWSVHHSNLSPEVNRSSTLWTARAGAWLSGVVPDRLLFVSRASRKLHQELGYAAAPSRVIPNGVDSREFAPRAGARERLRWELGLEAGSLLVGLVARWDPLKDHGTFLAAAARVAPRYPAARFVLCGDGITGANGQLRRMIERHGLMERCFLLGRREPVAELMQALDVACLASRGEAFPNVLVEAMACGVPAVATDVGDCAYAIGDTGLVAPPGDADGLGRALGRLLGLEPAERRSWGERARRRVQSHFELAVVARRYAELYEEVWRERAAAGSGL